jgi:hypothetical protein
MAQVKNLTWDQGADLVVRMNYKEGADVDTATIVDLSTGYEVRMDIVDASGAIIYTFNSSALTDADPITSGAQPDSVIEGTLTNGSGGLGNIQISIPRALTLPGGAVYAKLVDVSPVTVFDYDIFLRNTGTDTQIKILKGTVTIDGSKTLWL